MFDVIIWPQSCYHPNMQNSTWIIRLCQTFLLQWRKIKIRWKRIKHTQIKLVIVLQLKSLIFMVLIITPDILPAKIKFNAILRTKDNLALRLNLFFCSQKENNSLSILLMCIATHFKDKPKQIIPWLFCKHLFFYPWVIFMGSIGKLLFYSES